MSEAGGDDDSGSDGEASFASVDDLEGVKVCSKDISDSLTPVR